MLKFTAEHEWLKLEGDLATVGITSTLPTSWAISFSLNCRKLAPRSKRTAKPLRLKA